MTEHSNYWTRRFNRRSALRGAGLTATGLLGVALIGCGDDDDGAPVAPAATQAAAATATAGRSSNRDAGRSSNRDAGRSSNRDRGRSSDRDRGRSRERSAAWWGDDLDPRRNQNGRHPPRERPLRTAPREHLAGRIAPKTSNPRRASSSPRRCSPNRSNGRTI